MFLFLIPLTAGFACNLASAFTTAFCHWYGEKRGSLMIVLLRDVFGIPVWSLGFLLAFRASSPALFTSFASLQIIGWLLAAAGGMVILAALYAIRLRSIAPSARDTLVQNGLYGLVRHPIHSGVMLEFAGLILISPTLTTAAACFLGLIWVQLQTRFEEYDLLQRLPEYRDYMNRVPRFFPRLRHQE